MTDNVIDMPQDGDLGAGSKRFERVEEKIDRLGTELRGEIKESHDQLDQKIDGVHDQLDTKIDGVRRELEKKFDAKFDRLATKIDATRDRRMETLIVGTFVALLVVIIGASFL